ncbi:putative transporter [Klebsiella pneumoniae]|nr:putative transporter [Klebsiella pneumoniae]
MSEIALTVSVLALVAVVGLWIGNVKIRGVGFGIGGVLFGGIIVGHFVDQAGVTLSSPMLHFIQEFGLILFVYTIGIQVGPGFFASLRVSGLRLNLFAILIVILGGLVTAVLHKLFNIPLPVVLGIFSGAVTNTPALGAGQQILRDLGVPFEVVDQMGMSYAMAYPFGICGILLTMWLVRLFFRINVEKEAQRFEESSGNGHAHLHTINVRVENPNLNQMAIQDVPMLNNDNIVCSRLKRGELLMVPAPGTLIQAGDLLHLVGRPEDLHNAQLVIGQEVATSLSTRGTDLKVERVVVTNEKVLGKKIRDLHVKQRYDVVISRLNRAGVELVASSSASLQFGDILNTVGRPEAIDAVAAGAMAKAQQKLQRVEMLPVVYRHRTPKYCWDLSRCLFPASLQHWSWDWPGRPLIMALNRPTYPGVSIVKLRWFMPPSANLALRELGIVLFLAVNGLKSGSDFVATLTQTSMV